MSLSDFVRRNWHPALVFAGACALWITRMPLVTAYYERTQQLGYYPPEADSIGIPIASNAVVTVMLFPAIVLGLWLILRNFPACYSWLAWNKNHWFMSAFWTAICGYLLYLTFDYGRENWQIGLPLNVLSNCGCLLLWFELRAIITSKL